MIKKLYLITLLFPMAGFALTYTTTFSTDENPISEGGNWINGEAVGLDWADCSTTNGYARGMQSGAGGFDDSTALLTGTWGSNQTASATVFMTNTYSGAIFEEVEIRLLSVITAHTNTGYEVYFRCVNPGGYAKVTRFNGVIGDWTDITVTTNSYPGLTNGAVISASISNGVIIGSVDGVPYVHVVDTTFLSGNPGIGFYLQGGTEARQMGFGLRDFTVTDGLSFTATNGFRSFFVQ